MFFATVNHHRAFQVRVVTRGSSTRQLRHASLISLLVVVMLLEQPADVEVDAQNLDAAVDPADPTLDDLNTGDSVATGIQGRSVLVYRYKQTPSLPHVVVQI